MDAIKFLFIRTGLEKHKRYEGVAPPLGLMYLAAVLREWSEYEFKFKLINLQLDEIDSFSFSQDVADFSPDLIGISSFTIEANVMHRVAAEIKKIAKDKPIIAGGPHASTFPQEVMEDQNFDYAVIGEGEKTICELVDKILKGKDVADVKGIAYRKQGKFIQNEPREFIKELDEIPIPAWDILDVEAYWKKYQKIMPYYLKSKRIMDIFTSRACPYNCAYCHRIFGKGFRARSPESVLLEMETLYKKYNVGEFIIWDDIFNLKKERAMEICDRIIDSGMNVRLSFPNGLRGDLMDRDLIYKLHQAGAWRVHYAIETASPRLQKLVGKNLNLDKLNEAINHSVEAGMLVGGFFMLGFPTETAEEIQMTIDFALQSRLQLASFSQVAPFPGTALFEMAKKENPEWANKLNVKSLNYFAEASFYRETTGVDVKKMIEREVKPQFYSFNRILRLLMKLPINTFLNFRVLPLLTYKTIRRKLKGLIKQKPSSKPIQAVGVTKG